jgi:hypothetical protein
VLTEPALTNPVAHDGRLSPRASEAFSFATTDLSSVLIIFRQGYRREIAKEHIADSRNPFVAFPLSAGHFPTETADAMGANSI